ncbi:hypothetical protein [Acanthopleuribacter pedis]|nr:hypothetical protein [Acanthopleuribacter pedis]
MKDEHDAIEISIKGRTTILLLGALLVLYLGGSLTDLAALLAGAP